MDDEEDVGTKASSPFIGPLLPSPVLTGGEPKRVKPSPPDPDPQAAAVRKKIDAVKASTALSALSQYEDEDDEDGSNGGKASPTESKGQSARSTPAATTPPPSDTASSGTIPASSFYASASELPQKEAPSQKRRKTPISDSERSSSAHFARQPLHMSPKRFPKHKRKSFTAGYGNPYNSMGSGNLHRSDTRHGGSKSLQHYGKKRPKMLI